MPFVFGHFITSPIVMFHLVAAWSNIGLSVEDSTNTTISCTSTHLTSFAVLVDVSGASQVCYRSIDISQL